MIQKPEIQYIGQFYVYGSEAREAALKAQKEKAKAQLPKPRLEKIQKIYIDPVALLGITVALVILVAMAIGGVQLKNCWNQYNRVEAYLTEVKHESAMVEHAYRTSYDLERIQGAAEGLGMIPASEAKVLNVRVTMPKPKAERTAWDDFKWFVRGLVD